MSHVRQHQRSLQAHRALCRVCGVLTATQKQVYQSILLILTLPAYLSISCIPQDFRVLRTNMSFPSVSTACQEIRKGIIRKNKKHGHLYCHCPFRNTLKYVPCLPLDEVFCSLVERYAIAGNVAHGSACSLGKASCIVSVVYSWKPSDESMLVRENKGTAPVILWSLNPREL